MPLPVLPGPPLDGVWTEEILWGGTITTPGIPQPGGTLPFSEVCWGGWVSSPQPVDPPDPPPDPPPAADPPGPLLPGELTFPVDVTATVGGFAIPVVEASGNVPISAAGAGSVKTLRWLAPAVGDGDVMTISVRGRPAISCSVDSVVEEVISPQEEAGQFVTISGPGWADEWRRMLLYPDLGAEVPTRLGPPIVELRTFNFASSSGVDTSSWLPAVVTDPKYGQGTKQRFTRPEGWPDRWSQWIWSRSSASAVPAGTNYFRRVFGGTNGSYQLWVAANDAAEIWIDGALVATIEGPYTGQATKIDLELGDHFHIIGAKVINRGGRAGLNYSLLPIDGDLLGSPVIRSTPSTLCLGYVAPPKFTIGKVLRIALDEAHARGTLTGWGISFGDEADSAGRTWPPVENLAPRVGLDGLSLLRWAAEQHIDFVASPGSRTMNAYLIDTLGAGGVVYTDAQLLSATSARGSAVAGGPVG